MIVNINSEISLDAAKLYLEINSYAEAEDLRTPSLADVLVYATAKKINDKLVTGDKLFKKIVGHYLHWRIISLFI